MRINAYNIYIIKSGVCLSVNTQMFQPYLVLQFLSYWIPKGNDNGHPERAFFQKFKSFGLGQTNWAEILGCILVISSQTIGTILAL